MLTKMTKKTQKIREGMKNLQKVERKHFSERKITQKHREFSGRAQ